VGLVALTASILLPAWMVIRRFPAKSWSGPGLAPLPVLATILLVFFYDSLANALINPIFVLVAGGLGTLATAKALERPGVPVAQACRSHFPPVSAPRPPGQDELTTACRQG